MSKLITAMAIIRLLQSHHISVDAPIWPYLPAYWVRGDSIDQLTFRNLLLHKTGLVINGPKSASDFQIMKAAIARGVRRAIRADQWGSEEGKREKQGQGGFGGWHWNCMDE